MKNLKLDLPQFCTEMENLIEVNSLDVALEEIKCFVESIIFNPRSIAKVFSSAELDGLCKKIANKIDVTKSSDGSSQLIGSVVIATELHAFGGHVSLLEGLIRSNKSGEIREIILTDLFNRSDENALHELSKRLGVRITVCEKINLADKLCWVVKNLSQLLPKNIILLSHHQDSVAISGSLTKISKNIIFIHHADHHLALGVTCKDFLHVDIHNMGYFFCRDKLGISANKYWPLTFAPSRKLAKKIFFKEQVLITCSSGRESKFTGMDYRFDYFSFLPELLANSGGKHIHIGPLSDSKIQQIEKSLFKANISKNRFVHITSVPSLYEALTDLNIDLFISSFPMGGGMASIEAMAAGIPLLMHRSYKSYFLDGCNLVYPEAYVWTNKNEFLNVISNIKLDDLIRHSSMAKAHFDRYYSQKLQGSSNFIDALDSQKPPPLMTHPANSILNFIDDELLISREIESLNNTIHQYIKQAEEYEEISQKYSREINLLSEKNRELNIQINNATFILKKLLKIALRKIFK